MKLRDYETKAVRELPKLLRRHHRVVAVGPTGCGKTVIGAAIVRNLPRRKRVLWLAHRYELLAQARAALLAAGVPDGEIGVLSGVETTNPDARILLASVDMFRARRAPEVDLIVVDEAHHGQAVSYRVILNGSDAAALGLTATPERLDGEPLGDIFAHMYSIAEAAELEALGFLVPPVVYGLPREKAVEIAKQAAGRGQDYDPRKLEQAMRKRPLMADIIEEWQRRARELRTIVYACNRAHGRDLARRFKAAGAHVAYLDAETPAARREELLGREGLLATGKLDVIVNVQVITEGFDCPPVGCIIVARPTKSLVLWMQMCGRGARPWGRKRRFLLLDHAGNTWRHGFPNSPREWSLERVVKGGGIPPVKRCEADVGGHQCGAMNPIAAKACCECGAVFPLTPQELGEQRAELERLREREGELAARREILRGVAKLKGLTEEWVERQMQAVA